MYLWMLPLSFKTWGGGGVYEKRGTPPPNIEEPPLKQGPLKGTLIITLNPKP